MNNPIDYPVSSTFDIYSPLPYTTSARSDSLDRINDNLLNLKLSVDALTNAIAHININQVAKPKTERRKRGTIERGGIGETSNPKT